jgi:hypothetical protein
MLRPAWLIELQVVVQALALQRRRLPPRIRQCRRIQGRRPARAVIRLEVARVLVWVRPVAGVPGLGVMELTLRPTA